MFHKVPQGVTKCQFPKGSFDFMNNTTFKEPRIKSNHMFSYKQLLFILLLATISSCKDQTAPTTPSTSTQTTPSSDQLPSWNEGPNKKAIIDFVQHSTDSASPGFIPEADRIACFDNDGTLWTEQPAYFQLLYAIDRIKKIAPQHPEWKTKEPYASVLKGDMKGLAASGEKGLVGIVMATHAGLTTEEFDQAVKEWLTTAKHPKTGKPITSMTYQPMIELLQFLRSHGFKTFIVSGGGIDFMRSFAESVYGIPPYQVIGSSGQVSYQVIEGKPRLMKLPGLNFNDDKEGKPVGIHQAIGKRPVFTAGNSDGDFAMLQYTTTATGYPRFGMIIHHTDSIREYAYDRKSAIGSLSKGLDSAAFYKWNIIDMKQDWKKIYGWE